MSIRRETRFALAGVLAGILAAVGGLGSPRVEAQALSQDRDVPWNPDTTQHGRLPDETQRGRDVLMPPDVVDINRDPSPVPGEVEESGTGGSGDTGPGQVLDEDEGVLQRDVKDERPDTGQVSPPDVSPAPETNPPPGD